MTTGLDALQERVRDAGSRGAALRVRGGGTKDFYGGALEGELLDVGGHRGIVDYEPSELVVTARCGTPLAELEATLAEQGQCLPFEPPHFGAKATVGGCVAAGLSGPRRTAAGALRDFVLGTRVVDGRGRVLQFGGRVMKNVAGYDASRLMAGALGTLGIIAEVSLKVLPRAQAETTVGMEAPEAEAIDLMNRWAGRPLPITATAWLDGRLFVRLAGAAVAVEAGRRALGGDAVAEGARFWDAMREHADPFFAGAEPLWRIALPSTARPLGLPGRQLIEWGGAQRWLKATGPAEAVRAAAGKAGGHATLFRASDKSAGAFTPLSEAQARLHRGIKATFDPHGILNRGRLYPDF